MATGTDDDKATIEGSAAHQTTDEHASGGSSRAASVAPTSATTGIDADTHMATDHRQQSLWTASDARGPLEKASDDPVLPIEDLPIEDEPSAPADRIATASPHATEAVPASNPEPAQRSVWPIAAGIVVGALIGAGAALLAESQGLTGRPTGASETQLAALSSKVDALEKRPAAASGDLQGVTARLSALADKVDGLEKRPEAPAQTAAPAGADIDTLKKDVASLQASVEALKTQASRGDHGTDEKVAALSNELAGLKSTASQNEASLASVKDDQKRLSDKVAAPAFAAAADSLVRQVDQGEPYRRQVDALTTLGADPAKLAVLQQNADRGVPSAKTLSQKFEPLAEPISASTQKVPANAGFVDRLKSGMLSMVSIRSVDDTSGSDLPSRVARIKLDLAHDDVADAVATWDALPADAKAKGEAWAALARSRASAMAAARSLQQDAIAALSAKKS